jgi:hypothetical protein
MRRSIFSAFRDPRLRASTDLPHLCNPSNSPSKGHAFSRAPLGRFHETLTPFNRGFCVDAAKGCAVGIVARQVDGVLNSLCSA